MDDSKQATSSMGQVTSDPKPVEDSSVSSGQVAQGQNANLGDSGQVQEQPQTPASTLPAVLPHKEAEPISSKPVLEQITLSEHKIELSEELKEAGVEHAKDTERAELSSEVKEAGVEHAKESVGMDPIVAPMVQLPPYKREEVLPHTKTGSVSDAAKWFYVFLLRQIDKVKKQNLTQK